MSLATTDVFKNLTQKNPNLVHLNDEDVKLVQTRLLEMAEDIISVLEENNCIYHLTGGSALGAIRHKGFIPWDDDMDIDISRESYDTFLKAFTEKFGDKYYIHNPYSKDGYCLPSTQIRLKNSQYKSVNDYAGGNECGLPIDLVMMENTFDNAVLRKIHGSVSLAFGLAVSCRKFAAYQDYFLDLVKGMEEETKIFKKKIMIGKCVSFLSLEAWTKGYDHWNALCKNNHTKYVVVPTGRKHFFGELYERDKFYKTTKGQFENHLWDIPADYDYYLSKLYGDYMKIPDESEREKHVLLAFDLK